MIVRKHTYHLYSIYIIYVLAERVDLEYYVIFLAFQSFKLNKGNNKITEHRAIFQRKMQMSINRQNQSTTGKLGNRNGPDLVQAFPKKWWIESDFTAPRLFQKRTVALN
jgi:hypothetical protein